MARDFPVTAETIRLALEAQAAERAAVLVLLGDGYAFTYDGRLIKRTQATT